MFCPNCGNNCGTDRFCSACGQELFDKQVAFEPPVGTYEAKDGYLDVSYYTMTICKELPDQTLEKLMSFADVKDVRFRRATQSERGYLAIREKNDYLPMPETQWDAVVDGTALTFEEDKNEMFSMVFAFLDRCKVVVQAKIKMARDVKSVCPRCKSRNIRNRCVTVPVAHCIMDEYICCVCGYFWNSESLFKKQKKGLSEI